jgi:hypothetical protein
LTVDDGSSGQIEPAEREHVETSHPYAPGFAFYLVAIAAGVALLVIASGEEILGILLMLYVGLGLGLVWLVTFAISAFQSRLRMTRRSWLRWLGLPAMGFLCLALAMGSYPLRLRFELSRPALEDAVRRAAAGQDLPAGNYGLFRVDGFMTLDDGGVFLEMDSTGFIDPCGLAYSSANRPAIKSATVDLGGGWWFACEDF